MAKIIPRISIILPNGASAEVRQSNPASISANTGRCQGMLCMVKIVTPDFTNNVTTLVRLYDRNGILLAESEPLDKNSGAAGYVLPSSIPITYGEYVTAQPSGDPGSDGTVTVDMDYIPDHFMELI